MDILRTPLPILLKIHFGTKSLIFLGLLACYMAVVRFFRYRFVKELRRKYPDPDIVLKDSAIAEEIYCHTFRKEFPSKWVRGGLLLSYHEAYKKRETFSYLSGIHRACTVQDVHCAFCKQDIGQHA